MKKKKIGILGGTFNPIHNAHLAMAEAALQQSDLEEIWFMPSKNPPHKSNDEIVSELFRSSMIKLAILLRPHFIYSDYELQREGTTYTAETLKCLKKDYPNIEFSFIIGGDSFFNIEKWYHPEEILSGCRILAISRDGATIQQMQQHKEYLIKKYHADIKIISMEQLDISSSQIRQSIKDGAEDIPVPKHVAEYIRTNTLYK